MSNTAKPLLNRYQTFNFVNTHPVIKGNVDVSHGTVLYMEDVSVSFDGFKALNNLSLYIDDGELLSGFTTLYHDYLKAQLETYRMIL